MKFWSKWARTFGSEPDWRCVYFGKLAGKGNFHIGVPQWDFGILQCPVRVTKVLSKKRSSNAPVRSPGLGRCNNVGCKQSDGAVAG
jgi:hypothetical protein